jgi:hypothetical protein
MRLRTRAIRRKPLLVASVLLAALVAGLALFTSGGQSGEGKPVGLFTSLPILWGEQAELRDALKPEAEHWAKGVIERHGRIVPLDVLAGVAGQPGPLAGVERLIIAQPRPLSPAENVALDAWVRGGGRLLMFADPMLTEESAFAIGDKRRPQDIVMLSPILKHWGLSLEFETEDEFGEGPMMAMGMEVPVNMPGRLLVSDPVHCRSWEQNLIATCRIGQGRVLVLADAAVLERADNWGIAGKSFGLLLEAAFYGR